MSTVLENEEAIERLPSAQMKEIALWVAGKMVSAESAAMLAALDAGIESLQTEPVIPAEVVRKKSEDGLPRSFFGSSRS